MNTSFKTKLQFLNLRIVALHFEITIFFISVIYRKSG